MEKLCNGVFEGGGVRGIGHVGAACALEKAGYRFHQLAGSSAGAIVAALLAAGYTGEELKEEMKTINYMKFKQKGLIDYLGLSGKVYSLVFEFGIYEADYLENWLDALLVKKGKRYFSDLEVLPEGLKLQITASDVSDQTLLILPQDIKKFGMEPSSLRIAQAVRMSMSIPLFYEPFHIIDACKITHYIVDGGLLSNYPMWLLDNGKEPQEVPTFGFKFGQREMEGCIVKAEKVNFIDYLQLIVSTSLEGIDNKLIANDSGDLQRTIFIPTKIYSNGVEQTIKVTDFDISEQESMALFQNGYKATNDFLATWNYTRWKQRFRPLQPMNKQS